MPLMSQCQGKSLSIRNLWKSRIEIRNLVQFKQSFDEIWEIMYTAKYRNGTSFKIKVFSLFNVTQIQNAPILLF